MRGGGGDTNLARIQSYGLTQTVDLGVGGSLDLTGGTGTGFNFARIEALNGDQSVTGSGAITITGGPSGGAVGTGNFADIRQRAATKLQSVSASALTIEAGAGGVDNNAGMRADGNQTVALETAGSNALKIGAATSAGVSYITGNNQIVTAGNGAQSGSITVRGGTVAGQNAGIFNNSGTQTIATTGVLQMTGGTAVGSASSCGAATGGSCADINNDGTGLQKVSAGTINLQGGNAGVGNGAGIFVSAGNMEINAGTGGLHLTGGTGTSDNFASIGGGNSSGRTLKINVIGDTTLDAANGTTGSGSFIGLGSTGNLGSTTIDFNGTGNLTLTGSTVSSTLAGAAIGAGSNQTNTTATIDIDAADITFVPNISGVRFGHGVSANGPGVITINATGSVALNSSGTVGSAIRTTGNVFIHADGAGKTITEGASSVIGADTLTVSANAGVALPGANRVATLNASSLAGNIDFSNTQSLSVGSASTGAGAQAVGISAIGGSSSLTLGATTSDDNWTLISGGATVLGGAFSANDISITSGAALALSQNLVVARTLDLITPNGNNIVQTGGAITAAGQTTVNAVGGTVFLAGAGNNFNQIGVTGGAVTLTDVNAVTLGNSTVQDLFLSAGGSITMGGSVTATGPGTAIELVVGSGAGNGFVNPIGSGALNATGGGRWLVYSNDPALDTRGGLVYGFKQYGAVFGDTVLGTTGNGFIMGLTPTVTASLTGPVSKPYDRLDTATLTGANYLVSGLPGDVLTLNNPVAGTYDTRNAGGPNKIVTVTGVTVASAMDGTATVFGYPNVGTLSGPVGTIVAATITAVNGITASKEYDGTASATALTTGATFTGKLPGDILTVASGSGNFTGPNAIDVGSGKPLAVSGIVLGGTDVGNYTLAAAATTATGAGTITARAVSNWTGTTPGALWSDSANWDVVPTAGNVLSVAIPAGAGSVVFDPAAGTTSLLNLSSQRPVSVTGGTLQIGTSLSTPSYDQSGGAVTGAGSMNVTGSFVQTGGSVALGSITITHASGNLVFANLSAPSVSLAAPTGAISQTGPLVAGSLVTASMSGTNLTTAGNQIGTWVAQNQGSGAISLVNTGALVLAGLNNNAGNIDVTNTGAITTVAAIVASAGSVSITANSPLYVGAGGVTASGDVTLIAGNISSGNLTLDGPVVAGNKVVLDAANTLAQNSSVLGPNGVTADAGVSMAAYGPLATSKGSSVVYRAGGVSVAPPPTELLATAVQPDVLVTFLELFEAAVAEQQGGSIATNADGSRKRKAADALVTEGEICRP